MSLLQTTVEAIQEDILAALENKNPQVKAETASFIARCFTKCTPVMLNKKLLKAYTTALLKTLNESGSVFLILIWKQVEMYLLLSYIYLLQIQIFTVKLISHCTVRNYFSLYAIKIVISRSILSKSVRFWWKLVYFVIFKFICTSACFCCSASVSC